MTEKFITLFATWVQWLLGHIFPEANPSQVSILSTIIIFLRLQFSPVFSISFFLAISFSSCHLHFSLYWPLSHSLPKPFLLSSSLFSHRLPLSCLLQSKNLYLFPFLLFSFCFSRPLSLSCLFLS